MASADVADVTERVAENAGVASDRGSGPLISLRDVSYTYPGASRAAVDGVSLDIAAGEYVCVLGGNGSGKSTLLQMVNALLVPGAGRVCVCGEELAAGAADMQRVLAVRRQVAMVFQHPEDQMVTSIVADDVAFGPENLGVEPGEIARRVDAALAAVGMSELAGADPADLSGGQKQRVAIAGALAMEPRVLLLDEPGAMLDVAGREAVRRIVRELAARGITIVHVTHHMEDALDADHVLVMRAGHVMLEGTPAEVFSRRDELAGLGLELPFEMQLAQRVEELRAAGVAGCDIAEGAARGGAGLDEGAPAIEFENVSFSYAAARPARRGRGVLGRKKRDGGRGDVPLALDGVTFRAGAGSLVALVGHTGSGKSTTAELACALKLPLAGAVRVAGIDTADLSRRRELRRQVGYVSQLPERQLFAETVYDDVAFGPRNLGLAEDAVRERVRGALASVGLDARDEALLARSPFSLSGGQQRSVALAGVLAMDQRVLVLDEPMAGLDPAGRAELRVLLGRLRATGRTLLVVTHDMDDVAELADLVVSLDHGHVAACGTPREVFAAEVARAAGEPALVPGLPSALTCARKLAAAGDRSVLERLPLTLEELARMLAARDEEVRHGA